MQLKRKYLTKREIKKLFTPNNQYKDVKLLEDFPEFVKWMKKEGYLDKKTRRTKK